MLSTGHTLNEIGAQLKLISNTVSIDRAQILKQSSKKTI
ncbi:hypothetical protein MIZ03_4610 [Rhodoferax lithotrophicus]|uniref:HTH luxR-type domain-containing protein n=1 Tax=Rhodoferax lithotrophicus TaxID=2798804 RepID=A0ABN6DG95_9BURK|nr:hypothetical protein MIZ03_4610 [Rhodoferax sp. MIZ03]